MIQQQIGQPYINHMETKQEFQLHRRLDDFKIMWANLKPDEFTYPPCPICGRFNYETISSLVINWVEFFIVKCPTCKLSWRTPIPDKTFLNDLYSEKYYNVKIHSPSLIYQVGIADDQPADQQMRKRKSAEEVLKWIERGILPIDPLTNEKNKLLEIGGGRGYLQSAAHKKGWSTIGLEISPHGIKQAIDTDLLLFPIALEELCEKYVPYERYFDVIVFFDFLEHITDPCRVFRLIRYILKDKGKIILRIPISRGEPKLHLIDHIWQFTHDSITLLLTRENFIVDEILPSGEFKAPNGDVIDNYTIFSTKRNSE